MSRSAFHNPGRFRQFLSELSAVVEEEPDEETLLGRCSGAMATLVAHDDWLPARYQRPARDRYRQNLLYCDPRERFSIVSFVWGSGQSTPIHDHQTWGVIGILRGAEISQSYHFHEGRLQPCGPPRTLRRGDVETLSPKTGDIHQVGNGLTLEPSVAIHVYGGDIGSHRRSIFTIDGLRTPFVSRYANRDLPNFWLPDRKARAGA